VTKRALTVGDADPFHSQTSELGAILKRHRVPVTTVFWTSTGDHMGHEY
jgi:hypothetical protein